MTPRWGGEVLVIHRYINSEEIMKKHYEEICFHFAMLIVENWWKKSLSTLHKLQSQKIKLIKETS